MDFDLALAFVLDHEGGYSSDLRDPGGETNYGITWRVARAHGYKGPMRLISLDLVRRIYRRGYWDSCHCEEMPDHPIRLVVFDAAVHSGPAQAIKWLQQELHIKADGAMGWQTQARLRAFNLDTLAHALIERRLTFLRTLSTWKIYGKGWTRRLQELHQAVATYNNPENDPWPTTTTI